MEKSDAEFLKRLLALFQREAAEHVQTMAAGLIGLEQAGAPDRQAELVEAIFREAHSLKGAARSVNLTEVESVCQALESALASMKRRQLDPSPEVLDVLHRAVEGLDRLIGYYAAKDKGVEKPRITGLIQQVANLSTAGREPPQAAPSGGVSAVEETEVRLGRPATGASGASEAATLETVRIASNRLDALFLQTEELLSPKLAAQQRAADLRELVARLLVWKKEWTQVSASIGSAAPASGGRAGEKPDPRLSRLSEFAEWNKDFMQALESRLAEVSRLADSDQRLLDELVDGLLQDMKQVLLMPFASLLEVFPTLVRELARDQGKEVDLRISGADIEIDRRVLQEIKDAVIHLVRNSLDHGIERPAERVASGKPPRGTVTVAVAPRDGNKVELLMADDGAGIDASRVRAAATRLGLTNAEEAEQLSDRDALGLIFTSGLSTSAVITDLSGRGLGLAIVQEKVERLGGVVAVESIRGAGTTFRLLLPLTLATMRGLLIRADEQTFVLPTAHVGQALRVAKTEIQTVENRETIPFAGQTLALVRLADALGLVRRSGEVEEGDHVIVVVLSAGGKRVAFQVDEVVGEQEVLVKQLGPQLARVRNLAGATVLGTGQLVPILNVVDLLKSAINVAAAPARARASPAAAAVRKAVLVVEDSITARALLKNILETAGYDVQTAVDGLDGFTKLRTRPFDLVVTDVDMPRLSGLDLTLRIRADAKLADTPVVLVTALESREDKERGIEVGANAYIVKQSFDQSNLLDVIRRLI